MNDTTTIGESRASPEDELKGPIDALTEKFDDLARVVIASKQPDKYLKLQRLAGLGSQLMQDFGPERLSSYADGAPRFDGGIGGFLRAAPMPIGAPHDALRDAIKVQEEAAKNAKRFWADEVATLQQVRDWMASDSHDTSLLDRLDRKIADMIAANLDKETTDAEVVHPDVSR